MFRADTRVAGERGSSESDTNVVSALISKFPKLDLFAKNQGETPSCPTEEELRILSLANACLVARDGTMPAPNAHQCHCNFAV